MGYIIIIGIIFLIELLIKNKIEKQKEMKIKEPILGGNVYIRRYHNKGAFLNLGEKIRPVIAILSCIMIVIISIVFVVTLTQKGNKALKIGLSILLGGAFSNTYDRVKRKYVVDYFSFQTKSPRINRVIFNLADFCIMIGALITTLSCN